MAGDHRFVADNMLVLAVDIALMKDNFAQVPAAPAAAAAAARRSARRAIFKAVCEASLAVCEASLAVCEASLGAPEPAMCRVGVGLPRRRGRRREAPRPEGSGLCSDTGQNAFQTLVKHWSNTDRADTPSRSFACG
jgi:hypothetical protein